MNLTDWSLLLGATLLGALNLRAWHAWRPIGALRVHSRSEFVLDVVLWVTLFAISIAYLCPRYSLMNPRQVPYGQDAGDYLRCMLAIRDGDPAIWQPHRYPLFPSLSVLWARASGVDIARGAQMVALSAAVVTPPIVYAFGRTLTSRPVAFAGAALSLELCFEPTLLGSINAYPLTTAMFILSLATVTAAVRDGGMLRHVAAGVGLSLYGSSTAAAFPTLGLGAVAVCVATMATHGRRPWSHLIGFMLPLGIFWAVFAVLPFRLYPLEALLYEVQEFEHLLDPRRPFPDVGWNGSTEAGLRGYWIPGHASALLHLREVFTYLIFPPVHPVGLPERYNLLVPSLASAVGAPEHPLFMLASLVGVAGAGAGAAATPRKVVAALALSGLLVAQAWSLTGASSFVFRYAQGMILVTPVLLLAAAALPARQLRSSLPRAAICWAPLIGVMWWVLGPSPGAFGRDGSNDRLKQWSNPQIPVEAVLSLKARIQPDDVLLGVNDGLLGRALFGGNTAEEGVLEMTSTGSFRFRAPGLATRQRWLLLGCVDQAALDQNPGMMALRTFLDQNADRFEPVDRCIYHDLQPTQAIEFEPIGCIPRSPPLPPAPPLLGGPRTTP